MKLIDGHGDTLMVDPSDSGGLVVLRIHEEADRASPEANADFGLLPDEAMAVGVVLIRWAKGRQ